VSIRLFTVAPPTLRVAPVLVVAGMVSGIGESLPA